MDIISHIDLKKHVLYSPFKGYHLPVGLFYYLRYRPVFEPPQRQIGLREEVARAAGRVKENEPGLLGLEAFEGIYTAALRQGFPHRI